ncbi:hypothetical protein SAMN06269185_3325 [Natronoarchaeum philippinense]|uniref:Uncharacterized protein n=1 Tax=Natronoarchaeum philippinense TaxID=558529 RepID=A0A285P977_NATPI|nr:hypothetical protein [Natronoarchaeum philippinense]SNZ18300.1 hypothetical protein SAMN06269185_3325 [Natronoarchaeum philippinense]
MTTRYDTAHSPLTNDELMTVLREAWEAGDRDILEGGVATTTIAARIDMGKSGTESRLRELWEAGRITVVWGADPDTHRPRRSWAPADEVDQPGEDLPGDTLRGDHSD